MTHEKWTESKIASLRLFVAEGMTVKAISNRMDIPRSVISKKMSSLGIARSRGITLLVWDEDMTSRLLGMWKTGHSATECARLMSRHYGIDFTRNMVIGRLHRVGAPTRSVAVRKLDYVRPPAPRNVRRPPGVMNLTEAARVAGVSLETMRRWANGCKKCSRTDTGWIIPLASVEDYRAWVVTGRKADPVYETSPSFHARAAVHNHKAPADVVSGERLHLMHDRQCRWPVNDWEPGHGDDALFCGADTVEGFPYCSTHGARAYAAPVQTRRSGIRETNIKRRKQTAINLDDAVIGIDGRMEAA